MPNKQYKILLSTFAAVCGLLAWSGSGQATIYTYGASLDGSQEVPPNGSAGTGTATFTIDDVANTVTYTIMYSGLSAPETAAHIHGMAPPGANAGVLHSLPAGQPKNGVWNYLEAQEAGILSGLTYVNIHTSAFPGGEIRGQIVPVGCWLNCPALDGGLMSAGGSGNKSPDLNGDGSVNLTDFAVFGGAFGNANNCVDFNCSGLVDITDFAIFGAHFNHGPGSAGICY